MHAETKAEEVTFWKQNENWLHYTTSWGCIATVVTLTAVTYIHYMDTLFAVLSTLVPIATALFLFHKAIVAVDRLRGHTKEPIEETEVWQSDLADRTVTWLFTVVVVAIYATMPSYHVLPLNYLGFWALLSVVLELGRLIVESRAEGSKRESTAKDELIAHVSVIVASVSVTIYFVFVTIFNCGALHI